MDLFENLQLLNEHDNDAYDWIGDKIEQGVYNYNYLVDTPLYKSLAENAIKTILNQIEENLNIDYNWIDAETCRLTVKSNGENIGYWDVDVTEIEDTNSLSEIASEIKENI